MAAAEAEPGEGLQRGGNDQHGQQNPRRRAPGRRPTGGGRRGHRGADALRETLGRSGNQLDPSQPRGKDLDREQGQRGDPRAEQHPQPKAGGNDGQSPAEAGEQRGGGQQDHQPGGDAGGIFIDRVGKGETTARPVHPAAPTAGLLRNAQFAWFAWFAHAARLGEGRRRWEALLRHVYRPATDPPLRFKTLPQILSRFPRRFLRSCRVFR